METIKSCKTCFHKTEDVTGLESYWICGSVGEKCSSVKQKGACGGLGNWVFWQERIDETKFWVKFKRLFQ